MYSSIILHIDFFKLSLPIHPACPTLPTHYYKSIPNPKASKREFRNATSRSRVIRRGAVAPHMPGNISISSNVANNSTHSPASVYL